MQVSSPLAPVWEYLNAPRCAIVSALREDGAPHPAVVHYLLEGDDVVVNGRADRVWLSNLRRDPRVALVVHDADEPPHWVGIKGNAEPLRLGRPALEDAMAMARRYGEDPSAYEDQERVSLRIVAERVFEYG